jgi:hypothetical protein
MRPGFARIPAISAVLIAIAHQFAGAPHATTPVDVLRADWARHPASSTVRAIVHVRESAVDGLTARFERLRAQARPAPCSADFAASSDARVNGRESASLDTLPGTAALLGTDDEHGVAAGWLRPTTGAERSTTIEERKTDGGGRPVAGNETTAGRVRCVPLERAGDSASK